MGQQAPCCNYGSWEILALQWPPGKFTGACNSSAAWKITRIHISFHPTHCYSHQGEKEVSTKRRLFLKCNSKYHGSGVHYFKLCLSQSIISTVWAALWLLYKEQRDYILAHTWWSGKKSFPTSQRQAWAECSCTWYQYYQSRPIPLRNRDWGKDRQAPGHTHPF